MTNKEAAKTISEVLNIVRRFSVQDVDPFPRVVACMTNEGGSSEKKSQTVA
jgi:hypothetical protein